MTSKNTTSHKREFFILEFLFQWGLVVLLGVSPQLFLKGITDFSNLPKTSFISITVLVLLIIWLAKGFLTGKYQIRKSFFYLPLIAFLLWALLSVFWAHNKYEGLILWKHWAVCSLAFFLVLNSIKKKTDAMIILVAILISGYATTLLGLSQYFFNVDWVPQIVKPAATFGNKNMATHFIVLTFPVSLAFFLSCQNKFMKLLPAAGSILMIGFVVLTKTRAGWVAVAVELFVLCALLMRNGFMHKHISFLHNKKILLAGAFLILIPIFIYLNMAENKWQFYETSISESKSANNVSSHINKSGKTDNAPDRPTDNLYDESTAFRIAIWKNTIEMIKDRPLLGFGLGNHKIFYPIFHQSAEVDRIFSEETQAVRVHNDFLQAVAELGGIGLLLIIWMGISGYRIAVKAIDLSHSRESRLLSIGIVAGITGILVNACFSFPFQQAVPPLVLMVYLGILVSFVTSKKHQWVLPVKKWIAGGITVASIAFLFVLIRYQYLETESNQHLFNATRLEQSCNWEKVIDEAQKAYVCNPHQIKPLSHVGLALIRLGNFKDGIDALSRVISAYPYDMNALGNIGVAYAQVGDFKKAENTFTRILKIVPDSPKAHNNLGNLYLQMNQPDRAFEEFKKAREFDPENCLYHFNFGTVAMQTGRYPDAVQAFSKAVLLRPDWAMAHKNLGILYYQHLDNLKKGIAHFKKALALNPSIPDADQIRSVVNNFEKQKMRRIRISE